MTIRIAVILMLGLALIVPMNSIAAQPTGSIPSPAASSATNPFQQQLIDTQKAFLDALRRGDAAYVRNAVANDFQLIAPNGDMADRSEILEYVHPPKDNKEPEPILYDFKVVQLSDSAAVVTYNGVFPGSNHRYMRMSNTWVKDGDQWKLKFQQSTINLFSADDV